MLGRTALSRGVLGHSLAQSRKGSPVRMMAAATKLTSPQDQLLDGVDVLTGDQADAQVLASWLARMGGDLSAVVDDGEGSVVERERVGARALRTWR